MADHRVVIHRKQFQYQVDPGSLTIIQDEENRVRFTNVTKREVKITLPAGLAGVDEEVVDLGPIDYKDRNYRDLSLGGGEGAYEYVVDVIGTGLEAEGASRPRIIIVR